MNKIFFDGGMGTLLQAQGLDTLPEIWNITHPDAIFEIHAAYAAAGCNILKANTFGANRVKLADSGFTPAQLISAGVEIARKALDKIRLRQNAPSAQWTPGACVGGVALDIGSTGKLLAPVGDLPFEEAVDIFAEMVRAGAAAGADLILIETMSDTYEIKAAMLAAKENSDLPIMVTFSPDKNGRLLTGADIETAAVLVESLGACAVGLNCGFGPAEMREFLAPLCAAVQIPVIFNPNGGMPKIIDGKTVFDLSPADFAAQMKSAAEIGGDIFGGCCGTTPEHLAEMIRAFDFPPNPHELFAEPPRTRISSFAQTVTLGEDLTIIGERLNPTGKPKLKKALRDGDMGFICNEALVQASQGARLLDVNVGLPGIDEEKMLAAAVLAVQGVTSVPLVIDTSDIAAAEAALRVYNGKPLLNSVNGKEESLEAVLPLVKKYGAAVIALALDDEGIPETAAGRVAIAEKIIARAAAHGIPKHDIVVDALTMTLSTNVDNAKITLEAVAELTKRGIHTVLGVSNVSFGLPARDKLNAAFLALAAYNGLSAAIANPADEAMQNTLVLQKILAGRDENCAGYVDFFAVRQGDESRGGQKSPVIAENPSGGNAHGVMKRGLRETIALGLEADAKKITAELLAQTAPTEIISTQLIPALDDAGATFADGTTFLPQLLKSAAAATAAFEIIRESMAQDGGTAEKRGKIVLATVQGDIHDIGKNIVRTLLENYNFEVFDLGKNVPPEEVVEAVLRENARLVGLSALMTTTVASMEETIARLRRDAPAAKIMVGGAVLTAPYAKKIGADFYSPDAMGAVRIAEEFFG
ncbi:MAG: homocysteine S-methyltransferase family protein [Defluviitaleaceae bacterium]|nr:homocysteine S-methyltransferase family protein [Defluviitaleaceae bacterium]